MLVGGVLLILGAFLYSLATIPGVSWLHDAGTALIVAGLSLIVSTASGKEAVRQQHAKDANIERKYKIYAPLYTELKQLWQYLESATQGRGPYPAQILVGGEPKIQETRAERLQGPVPRLTYWQTFKSDYRIDDFTRPTRELLDEVERLAMAYNAAAKVHTLDQQAQTAAADLSKKVREAMDRFEEGFLYIQEHYQGGNPPI